MTPGERSRMRQLPERGSHNPDAVHFVLDAGFLAHVGFTVSSQTFVIPMLYCRDGDTLYLHGAATSRIMQRLGTGIAACVAVTLVDGLVLARSAFHHSVNYRSVVAFGTARVLTEPGRKTRALRDISEHLIAGRWDEVRGPSRAELELTSVLEFSIEEASAKIRSGPPLDDEADYGRSVWAGVVPLRLEAKAPEADSGVQAEVGVPQYLLRLPWSKSS
jgi:nitroimidazol reductase NimA-like FMN-containing flavoprotein (pyridoxamine 5'-phosphate oxidase superfamily)